MMSAQMLAAASTTAEINASQDSMRALEAEFKEQAVCFLRVDLRLLVIENHLFR